MRSVNKLILIGNVGSDPEIRTTAGGTKVAKFSLATSEKRKDKDEQTQWHRITCFDKLADLAEEYIRKGDRLYIEGKVEYSRTEGDDGVTRYWTDVIARELVMLGGSSKPSEAAEETHRSPFD